MNKNKAQAILKKESENVFYLHSQKPPGWDYGLNVSKELVMPLIDQFDWAESLFIDVYNNRVKEENEAQKRLTLKEIFLAVD